MNGLLLSLPIWGEGHVDLWRRYALPSLLASGNLPALADAFPLKFLIHTTLDDAARLSPYFRMLERYGTVRIEPQGQTPADLLEHLHAGYRHGGTCFKNCQNMAIEEAWRTGAGIVFLSADQVWANGAGATMVETVEMGARALVHVGYRTANEEMAAALERDELLDISPRTLSQMFLRTNRVGWLPPSIEEPGWAGNPTNLRWSTGDGRGMLVRPMHANVTFAHPTHGPVKMNNGTDHDFGQQAFAGDVSAARAITDTTQFLAMGIEILGNSSPPAPARPQSYPPFHPAIAALQLAIWSDEWRRHWMQLPWWCQDGTLDALDPLRVTAEHTSAIQVDAILDELARLRAGGATPQELTWQNKLISGDWS